MIIRQKQTTITITP